MYTHDIQPGYISYIFCTRPTVLRFVHSRTVYSCVAFVLCLRARRAFSCIQPFVYEALFCFYFSLPVCQSDLLLLLLLSLHYAHIHAIYYVRTWGIV